MITYSRYRELIDRQLRIKDVRERVFQDNVIRPFLQELLPDYDIEPVDVKIRSVVHDYAQYCGTYLKGEKFVPATPDLCISDNWNWENRENHVIYRSVVEIKSPVLDPVTGFAPEQYKCLEEIERHLRAERNSRVILTDGITWAFYTKEYTEKYGLKPVSEPVCLGELVYRMRTSMRKNLVAERTSGGRPLIDGIKWKEEKIQEEGQGIGEFDKLKKQLVQFIEESKEKSH